ncbi:hypothetical protein Lal_00029667, partial [Lupinus albus]
MGSGVHRIKLATSLYGNNSKLMTNKSVANFVILRECKVKMNFQKAPSINEVVWLAHMSSWIKINSDCASKGALGLAGGGNIFRYHNGAYLGGFSDFFLNKDALFAELQAAIKAIQIAHQKGWRTIWLECDSTLLVDIFTGKGVIPWRLANNWHRCLGWISSMRFK